MSQNNSNNTELPPLIPASENLPEMTLKVIFFSLLLTAILAAADAYLALKIGTSIAASIPASVLAMGILKFFKRSNVLESNMIQTAASAGEGVSAAMAFVLPALIITQVWNHFPYWQTVLITLLGGILGVLFSIPLRRILFSIPTLRFPEGTAIGSVLRVSTTGGKQLKFLARGAGVGALLSFVQTGLKVIANDIQLWVATSRTVFGFAIGFEPALLAAGYIIGFNVGISILLGIILGWVIILPTVGLIYGLPPGDSAYGMVMNLWNHHLRYVGVGVLLIGGIWTLISLLKPVVNGFKQSVEASRRNKSLENGEVLPRTERDIPFHWMLLMSVVIAILMFPLIYKAMISSGLPYSHGYLLFVTIVTIAFVLIVGFVLGALCGYFSGLIGSTNSPLSGLIITGILLLGGLYLLLFKVHAAAEVAQLTTMVILITALLTAIPSVAMENIQDLKAGQIVGATPWKQQVILIIGVAVSAFVVAPVLNLLFNAYGMGGVFPRSGMDPTQMLAAPQAGLMATIAKGVLTRELNWVMVLAGAILATIIIIIDHVWEKKKYRFLVLAVGLAIYLPVQIVSTIFLGTLVSYFVKRRQKKSVEQQESQTGTLLACGLVAGSALMGVALAIPFVIAGSSNALAIVSGHFEPIAAILGVIALFGLCYWLYRTSCIDITPRSK